jgi:hypothetical protein
VHLQKIAAFCGGSARVRREQDSDSASMHGDNAMHHVEDQEREREKPSVRQLADVLCVVQRGSAHSVETRFFIHKSFA